MKQSRIIRMKNFMYSLFKFGQIWMSSFQEYRINYLKSKYLRHESF